MLGVFDSGIGGLTVVRRLREALPDQDIVYFADQAHVPYGDRSQDELLHLLQSNIRTLEELGVSAIVAACNTSCAVADARGWPSSRVPILDLIESAAMAVEQSGAQTVGVVATAATARSGSYARHIIGRNPLARVREVAAPALVPLVESGKIQSEEASVAVQAACAEVQDMELLVLGCTHYPLLSMHFEQFRDAATIVDPALMQAMRAAALVYELRIPPGSGTLRCISNADQPAFEANVARFLGTAAKA